VNEATQAKLEYHAVREALARYCACALGRDKALSLEPSPKVGRIREWMQQVREMMAAIDEYSPPPLGGVYDIRHEVRASSKAQPLEADKLAQIAETLDAAANVRAWLALIHEDAPTLAHLSNRIADFAPLVEQINNAIDSRGRVRDDASPRLSAIRQSIERAKGDVHRVFEKLLARTSTAKLLQYSGATFHADRYVLPLKAEHRGRIPGIIHRISDSGATVFVEPSESVALNNSIIQMAEEESREITRILRTLTQAVQIQTEEILASLRAIAVVDLLSAKSQYAKKRNCVCPEIDEHGRMDLHEARHPLLLELFAEQAQAGEGERSVVPIDVRLGDDFDVLVITGPNTGGKTVALKTVGLLSLMTQAGIPIPAGPGSRMPVFKQVFVDIGDEQSLQQSLSTFSSHLRNLLSVLEQTGSRSLVLIDELGAGTDPDEGAAIGAAVVDELLRLNARAMITTHLSELKALAFTLPRVDNAAVEFDVKSLSPTYRIRLGEPGNSNAIVIAERLGMPRRMVDKARSQIDGRNRALQKAIEGTLDSRRRAEEARRAAREAELAAERRREELSAEQDRLRQEHEEFRQWSAWINRLEPGDPVYLASLRREAKVVRMQLHKQTALVFAGRMDIEVSIRDLSIPPPEGDNGR
jgi:DNA mismatch repair protein MutS2